MGPLVELYRRFFTDEIMGQTAEIKKARMKVREIASKSMPVDKAIFSMVVENIPDPVTGQKNKVNMFSLDFERNTPAYLEAKNAVATCQGNEPLIVYVSKMQPFSSRLYDVTTRNQDKSESQQRLIAISRVLSG